MPYGPVITLKTAVRQQQSLTYPGFDNFLAVDLALRELEYGNLQRASIMFDQMWRDDRFYSVLRKRLDAPETVPLLVQPADDRAKARRIAESWGGVEDEPGRWDASFPAAQLADLQKWGLGVGIGVAEIVWRTDDVLTDGEAQAVDVGTKYSASGERLRWTPTLRIWDSQWIRWDSWAERYILQTPDGEVILPDIREQPHGDGKWVVHCPFGFEQAWRKGLVRPLAKCVTRRSWVDRDWARYNEKNGLSLDKAIVPGEAAAEAKESFFQAVACRNSETAIMVEQSLDPAKGKFDVELLEATAKTWDTFEASKGDVNTDIAVTVLGQNLTTEVGDAGSKAAEKGHAAVERSILRKDAASLAGTIYNQVLWHDAVHNYGDGTLAPLPVYEVDPPEDQGTKAKMISDLGAGLVQMQTAKAPVDARAILEEAGIQTISEQEEAAKAAVEAQEAAAAAANQPTPGAPDLEGNAPEAGKPGTQLMRAPLARALKTTDFAGLPIVIEHPAGSMRPFTRPDGTAGATRMQNDYGFIDGHTGADGEELDCYLGPDESAPDVHVVHQLKAPEFTSYDEDKILIGFSSADDAKGAYLAHRGEDGAKAIGGMSSIPLDAFKRKLKARTGTGKIRASAPRADVVVALQQLAERSGRAVAVMRAGPKAPKKLAYADRLVRASIALGARSLAVDLAAVKHEISAAKDFDDLEKRMASAFKGMDPAKLANIVKRARIMAQLGGQLSAVKQT